MWETPKTDWSYRLDSDGNYIGDRFNAVDYNRIKNNLDYLRDLAITVYEEFTIGTVGEDKSPGDYFYADEINQMEKNLDTINQNSVVVNYGSTPTYFDNGKIMDYTELNRLESAILDLYDKLTNQHDGRRKLTFNFGMNGGM